MNVRPAARTVLASITSDSALTTNSMPSCSALCQFMCACGPLRWERNNSTSSRIEAAFGSNSPYQSRPASAWA